MIPSCLRRFITTTLRIGATFAPLVALLSLAGVIVLNIPTDPLGTATVTASSTTLRGAPGNGRKVSIGPGAAVQLPTRSPSPPTLARSIGNHPPRRFPTPALIPPRRAVTRAGVASALAAPTGLPPLWAPPFIPLAPNDLVLNQNTALASGATLGLTSVTDEPSVSNVGSDVFYTGNFYAALSTDGGQTFSFANPNQFPPVYGGFCCDQRTIYEPTRNLTAWALLYGPGPGPDGMNTNEVRLAIAQGADGLTANLWTYWDFHLDDAGLGPGLTFDFPQLATSSNNLYLTTNALNPDNSINASVVFRCPLDALASPSGGPMSCSSYFLSGADTFTPVDGATSTMYWANHSTPATLQVFSWPESVDWPGIVSTTVGNSPFPTSGYSCPSPDGLNMCGTDDWTIHGGWVANGVVGFLWDAAQGSGGLGSFPYPYVHVVEIDQATLGLIDEPIIWSNGNAWSYAGVGVNRAGGLGVSLAYSGGGNFPGSAIMVRDAISSPAWQTINVQQGTNGPPGNRWGDFLTARMDSSAGTTWVATAFTQQGSCVSNWGPCTSIQPRFLSFGRQSYSCLALRPHLARPQMPASDRATTSPNTIFLPLVSNLGCLP